MIRKIHGPKQPEESQLVRETNKEAQKTMLHTVEKIEKIKKGRLGNSLAPVPFTPSGQRIFKKGAPDHL